MDKIETKTLNIFTAVPKLLVIIRVMILRH